MRQLLSALRRYGVVGVAKLLIHRISDGQIQAYKQEIERLNSRESRVHPFIAEAISLVKNLDIPQSNLTGLKNGPLKAKFEEFGSDKETRHSYAEIYDEILSNFAEPRILEIGLGSHNSYPYAGLPPGGSIRAFREAYTNAKLVGCDIDPQSVEAINEMGFVVDQTSENSLIQLVSQLSPKYEFDLIIDDGFHDIHANVRTLIHLFPLLSSRGFYVVEDIHVSMIEHWALLKSYLPGNMSLCDMSADRPSIDDNILLVFRKT
jgi:hypothetical protein